MMVLTIGHRGGRFVTMHVARVLKRDGGSGDQNTVMSLMYKKIINEDGKDLDAK